MKMATVIRLKKGYLVIPSAHTLSATDIESAVVVSTESYSYGDKIGAAVCAILDEKEDEPDE